MSSIDNPRELKCDLCKYHWCVVCRYEVTKIHSFFGCTPNYQASLPMKIAWVLGFIVLFPLLLLLYIPCYVAYKTTLWVYQYRTSQIRASDDDYVSISQGAHLNSERVITGIVCSATAVVMFAVGVGLNFICVPIFIAGFLFCMVPYYCYTYVSGGRQQPEQ